MDVGAILVTVVPTRTVEIRIGVGVEVVEVVEVGGNQGVLMGIGKMQKNVPQHPTNKEVFRIR